MRNSLPPRRPNPKAMRKYLYNFVHSYAPKCLNFWRSKNNKRKEVIFPAISPTGNLKFNFPTAHEITSSKNSLRFLWLKTPLPAQCQNFPLLLDYYNWLVKY